MTAVLDHLADFWLDDDEIAGLNPADRKAYAELLSRRNEAEGWHDPADYVERRLGERLWIAEARILRATLANVRTAVPSAFGVGKSFTAARGIAHFVETNPPDEIQVVTTAPTAHQVKNILWKEVRQSHRGGNLRGRLNLTEWWIDDDLVAFGRKPDEHNPESFQGIHAEHVLVVFDEASGVPANLYEASKGLLTSADCHLLAIGNPAASVGWFYDACEGRDGLEWEVIRIPVWDTPNFRQVGVTNVEELRGWIDRGKPTPEGGWAYRPLVTPLWAADRLADWGTDHPSWMAKVDAKFNDADPDVLIGRAWVEAARARNLAVGNVARGGHDVARSGPDSSALCWRRGPVITHLERWHGAETTENALRCRVALAEQGEGVNLAVDTVGLGAGVYDVLKAEKRPVCEFVAGATPKDKEQFVMLRDEAWWQLRKRFEVGDIDLSRLPQATYVLLAEELTAVKFTYTERGKIKVEQKDDTRSRIGRSPDLADALVMACWKGNERQAARLSLASIAAARI